MGNSTTRWNIHRLQPVARLWSTAWWPQVLKIGGHRYAVHSHPKRRRTHVLAASAVAVLGGAAGRFPQPYYLSAVRQPLEWPCQLTILRTRQPSAGGDLQPAFFPHLVSWHSHLFAFRDVNTALRIFSSNHFRIASFSFCETTDCRPFLDTQTTTLAIHSHNTTPTNQ